MVVFSQKKKKVKNNVQLDKTEKDPFFFRLRIYYLEKDESGHYNGEEEFESMKQVLNKMMQDFTLKEAASFQFLKFCATSHS